MHYILVHIYKRETSGVTLLIVKLVNLRERFIGANEKRNLPRLMYAGLCFSSRVSIYSRTGENFTSG